ncbi:hypothetical protein JOD69_004541, partial [Methylocaldum sp. RMAD-M]|nr:hypothetical protein [Methylocaldum sp. RMAD-M]
MPTVGRKALRTPGPGAPLVLHEGRDQRSVDLGDLTAARIVKE